MFRHEGQARSETNNRILAGYLSFVAGFVNSASVVLLGSFTSHVTGNVARFADDLARGEPSGAIVAAALVGAFFLGALLASIALESNALSRRPHVYGLLLLTEAALLAAVCVATPPTGHWLGDVLALALSAAMGLQNSLVTRLSGAVVRTTHLTGVVTDLGIETARWFRDWRARLAARTGLRLTFGTHGGAPFQRNKTVLLLTILVLFVSGAAVGALGASRFGRWAFALPSLLLVFGGSFAVVTGSDLLSSRDGPTSRK